MGQTSRLAPLFCRPKLTKRQNPTYQIKKMNPTSRSSYTILSSLRTASKYHSPSSSFIQPFQSSSNKRFFSQSSAIMSKVYFDVAVAGSSLTLSLDFPLLTLLPRAPATYQLCPLRPDRASNSGQFQSAVHRRAWLWLRWLQIPSGHSAIHVAR